MTQPGTKNGFATINNAELYYEVAGEGHPLVLLHAGVADSRMWDEQFAEFARTYHVVRYDLRGFGKSSVPATQFASHEELAQLLYILGIEHTYVLGISYGGKIALDFTLAHPEQVDALILVAPSVSGTEPTPDVLAFYEAEEEALEAEDLESATELNLKMWVDGPKRTPEQVNPSVRERIHNMQYHAFTTIFPEGAVEHDLEPPAILRLNEVKVPTLVIVGDHDIQTKLDLAQQLEAEISGAQKVIIEGVAHMVNMEKPAEFNQVVLNFLEKQR